jgi:hypothetical protein
MLTKAKVLGKKGKRATNKGSITKPTSGQTNAMKARFALL